MKTRPSPFGRPTGGSSRRCPARPVAVVASYQEKLVASFDLMRDKWQRELAYRAVCEAIADPSKLCYDLAVLVVSADLKEQLEDLDLLGGAAATLVVLEAKERLVAECTDVLDEFTHKRWK